MAALHTAQQSMDVIPIKLSNHFISRFRDLLLDPQTCQYIYFHDYLPKDTMSTRAFSRLVEGQH